MCAVSRGVQAVRPPVEAGPEVLQLGLLRRRERRRDPEGPPVHQGPALEALPHDVGMAWGEGPSRRRTYSVGMNWSGNIRALSRVLTRQAKLRTIATCTHCGRDWRPYNLSKRTQRGLVSHVPKWCSTCHGPLASNHRIGMYGVSYPEWLQMKESCDNRCEICRQPADNDTELAIDHCHVSGRVRGLLCRACNNRLAFVESDWIEQAMAYLERHS